MVHIIHMAGVLIEVQTDVAIYYCDISTDSAIKGHHNINRYGIWLLEVTIQIKVITFM